MRNRLLGLLTLTVALAISAHAQTYTESTLHTFTTANPVGTVTVDSAGNLYGALASTGTCQPGKTAVECGLIFKLNSSGKETVLHNFTSLADGASPVAPLTLDAAGNLYGVTYQGGNSSAYYPSGLGVVFKITPEGKFSILHKFAGSELEGIHPDGPLTIDSAGNLYGTAFQGGNLSPTSCNNGCGIVFKLTPKGVFSVLIAFSGYGGQHPGQYPGGNLILDSAGNIYGSAAGGPVTGIFPSASVLYQLTPEGQYNVLYDFITGCGICGIGNLVRDSAGNFFGAGYEADDPDFDAGGILEINTSDVVNFSYYFCPAQPTGICPNGAEPTGQIVESGGLLYGTTQVGGGSSGNGQGVVYQLNPATSAETVLYYFPSGSKGTCEDNRVPQGISMDAQGNLYGTATDCIGTTGGIVFKLTKN